MAKGFSNSTSASISTNTTTTLIAAPSAFESIYVLYIGADTSVAGTTSTASFQDTAGANQFSLLATTAIGHQENYYATSDPNFPGWKIGQGLGVQVVTAGGAAATGRFTVIYVVKGS